MGDLLDIGADGVAQIGNLVDEADLDGKKGVGGVFDQFGRAPVGHHHRRLVEIKRAIEFAQGRDRALGMGADDDAVGALEIADGRALAQEFRIGGDVEIGFGIGPGNDRLDLVASADRHGRFGDDDRVAVDEAGDLLGRGIDIGEISVAVAAPRRRADGDEDDIGVADRLGGIGGEGEPAFAHIGLDQVLQPGFVDRHGAGLRALRSWPHPCRCRSPHGRNRQNRRPRPVRHSRCRSWLRASILSVSLRGSTSLGIARCQRVNARSGAGPSENRKTASLPRE